jgi:hypothetical protein
MLDDELRERLADWVRPVAALAIPDIRVLRRRARRRRMRRAATAAVATAAVAAVVISVTAAVGDPARPAQDHPASPSGSPLSWPKAPGSWHPGAWRPAGPLPAADAGPTSAPYIVRLLPGLGTAQVRNMFTGQTIQTIAPPAGQFFEGITAAGDGRTFVLQAAVGGDRSNTIAPVNPASAAFDEMRLRADGRLESLSVLGTVPARTALSGFAVSPDASMVAYSTGDGFETVSMATGTGKRWPAVDAGGVAPLSLSWAGDRTVAFQWSAANNPHPPGIGIRVLNVVAPGNLLQASRLVVPYKTYCDAYGGCRDNPVITADGSKVLVTRAIQQGSRYTDSVAEYSVRTGKFLADVAPPVTTGFPGQLCVTLWSSPSGGRVVSFCGRYERYDHGHVTPITIHPPRYGTNLVAFAWVGAFADANSY